MGTSAQVENQETPRSVLCSKQSSLALLAPVTNISHAGMSGFSVIPPKQALRVPQTRTVQSVPRARDLGRGAEDLWGVVRQEVTRVVVDRARTGQILVAPTPAPDGNRRDACSLRGFDVVRGVADHHGGGRRDVELRERRVERIGIGFGRLDVVRRCRPKNEIRDAGDVQEGPEVVLLGGARDAETKSVGDDAGEQLAYLRKRT